MSLQLIMGCMYSGKSTELMRRVNRFTAIGKRVAVINHECDTRYTLNPVTQTHDGIQRAAYKVTSLDQLDLPWDNIDVVAIDEGQFYKDLVENVLIFVETYHLHVIVAGLSGDYQRHKFGYMLDLVPYADNLWLSTAYCNICKNGTKASFTKRITSSSTQVDVGSTDKYIAVCRKCYIN
jgi:thymidine kinase